MRKYLRPLLLVLLPGALLVGHVASSRWDSGATMVSDMQECRRDSRWCAPLLTRLRKGCESRGAGADECVLLGVLWREGRGGPVNLRGAHALFAQGCAGGNAVACTNLGKSSVYSTIEAESIAAFVKACQLGDGAGCYYAGERQASPPRDSHD